MDPALVALVGTLCGGIGLKVTEHFLGNKRSRVDDARTIRDELRISVTNQRTEISKLEEERDKYRNDFYDLKEKFIAMQTQLTIAIERAKNDERKEGE